MLERVHTGEQRRTVTIRPAEPSDDRSLAELDARAWPRELWVVPPQPANEAFFGPRRQVADVLVATIDSAVVGYVRLGPHIGIEANAHVLHLDAVAVDPATRGAGIGSALVQAAIAEARARGVRKLGLRALSTNDRAIAIYRRHGFTEEGRLREEIKLPDGSYADDVWFALFL